jgi:RNA polymerase sigma factor (sigma-70 family)
MLRVYQGLIRFNGRYALQPWVARIATNVSLDVTRARMRRPQTGDRTLMDLHEELRGHSDDPLEALERGLERERVNEVLASLPEHHREALIMREFEGRSHQEIGERLDLTPSQAKALIHRAKGSFRRSWENAKARGLAVLAPIFLAPFKVPQLFRRLMLPSQELAASAAAAPVVTTSVVSTGERVTAAAVAVLITGSAAVGAVALKQPEHKPKPVVSQSVQVTVPTASPEPVVVAPRRQQEERDPKAKLIPPIAPTPPAASETPATSSTESPSPTESSTPTPTPTIPPVPPWSMTFWSSVPIGNWHPELDSWTVDGTAGDRMAFSGEVSGPAVTRRSPEGRLYVSFSGSAHGASGKVSLSIILDTSEGQFVYQAPGRLTDVTEAEGSLVDYTFTGNYYAVGWPSADDGSPLGVTGDVPHDGTFQLDLRFWGDGTSLYEVGLALQESGL